MKRFLPAFILFATLLIARDLIWPDLNAEDSPRVVKAVAPMSYPPLAKAARVDGKVKVDVKIDPAGQVISAKMVDGHKLLQEVSETAALRWKFAPTTEDSKERMAQLTFTFIEWTERKESERGRISFIPPYEIEIVADTPVIER